MSTAVFVAILALTAVVTSFISGILGMAGGMILMGILLALPGVTVPTAMMLHGITQLASNATRALLWRQHADWRVFRGYAIGALVALTVFTFLRFVVSKPVALIAMGLTPFVALALPERLHLNVERRGQSTLCGLICSALSLTSGVSGPILDVFFVRSKMTRQKVVATKAMTQSFSHLLKIGYFGAIVSVGSDAKVDWWLGLMMVGLAFLGTNLSRRVLDRMNDKSFRFWTRWTVAVLGCYYLGDGAWLLLRA
jgi:uncharacterized membrane protein YfcA